MIHKLRNTTPTMAPRRLPDPEKAAELRTEIENASKQGSGTAPRERLGLLWRQRHRYRALADTTIGTERKEALDMANVQVMKFKRELDRMPLKLSDPVIVEALAEYSALRETLNRR